MRYPKISIVTPSYNQGDYIEKTLVSVAKQAYPNYEHIVMDGGSTDRTVEVLETWSERLTYWESQPDRGQSHAINKGLARSTGEILTWLNSDDQLTESALFRVAEAFEEDPEPALVYGNCLLLSETGSEKLSLPTQDTRTLLGGMSFAQPASFFSRWAYEQFGPLNETLDFAMDYDFFMPVAQQAERVRYLPHTLAKYLYHAESKSVQHNAAFAREYALILQKLLRSAGDAAAGWVEKLKAADLWESETMAIGTYAFSEPIPDEQLREAVLRNMVSQVKYYYAATELRKARHRLAWIKDEAPAFFRNEPQLAATYQRTRWLTPWLLRWLRRF